jgi:ribosomal-protein-alanine N-acetyltransferase
VTGNEMTGNDMTGTVRLRPMRWWDVAAAADLDAEVFGESAWSPETFWSELAHSENRCYTTAYANSNKLVGYAGVMVNGAEADVQTLAVAPAVQGAGLGRRLLEVLLAQATERGARRLMLEVRADSEAAIGLYRRLGFEQVAVRRGYYGPGADALIMRLVPR